MCAHVYAQTVHTCASHEKMFISYMDVQTCMARKTPSLHVHRTGGGVSQSGRGAWALPSLCLTLSRLHPRPQFLPWTARGLGQMPLKVGPAHLDLPLFPLAGSQEMSWTQLRAQGGGWCLSSVGTAVRRIPPGTPGWAAALLASTPRARRPWTRSARRPRALSLKAIWEGVPLPRACSPLPEHLCAAEAAWSFPHRPGPAGPCSPACTGLAGAPVGPTSTPHV